MNLIKIAPQSLVPMDLFEDEFPLRIEVAYAASDNLLFQERIYKPDARLWLHEDLAKIVLLAARMISTDSGYRCILLDGLRTCNAQSAMLQTQRVRDNPHWLEEPNRLLSPPGAGAHPRGMAIDIALESENGDAVDMGTAFDFLAENPEAEYNPAHRDYHHSQTVQDNRAALDKGMLEAARLLNLPLLPLPVEWWDYRFPKDVYEQYEPMSDHDLPPQMSLVCIENESQLADFDSVHFESKKKRIVQQLDALTA